MEYRGDDFFSVEYRCRQIFMDEEETLTFCLKMMVNLFFFFKKKKKFNKKNIILIYFDIKNTLKNNQINLKSKF